MGEASAPQSDKVFSIKDHRAEATCLRGVVYQESGHTFKAIPPVIALGNLGCSRRAADLSQLSRRGPRMGAAVDLHEPIGVNGGINLRGRKRSVAEQFLDRPQVAAAGEQVGRERMA